MDEEVKLRIGIDGTKVRKGTGEVWNDRTDRRGRPAVPKLETDAARPRSVQ
jgi:hypothetical protein